MANFEPFKAYILETLDDLVDRHGLTSPFLDVGCGRGDVAAHLAARGWLGRAIDVSPDAVEAARRALRGHPRIEVACESLEQQAGGPFPTIVMLDVLEHVPDDRGALRAAAALQPAGGALLLVVPTNHEREWRWDDDLYGHLRRYGPRTFADVLASAGYAPVEMWDVTFPIFWLLRRGFTALKQAPPLTGSAWERTTRSVSVNAWDMGIVSRLLSNTVLWRPVFALQRRYRERLERGHEMIVLARRIG